MFESEGEESETASGRECGMKGGIRMVESEGNSDICSTERERSRLQ